MRVAVRNAFDAARRQLEETARVRRVEVKRHEPPSVGRVARLFAEQGYGFIETLDHPSRELYFHRNSLPADDFNALKPGQKVRFHEEHGRLATLTGVHPLSRFGVVESEGGLVRRFREKPQLDGLVSGGFFVFRRGVFDYLDDNCVLEQEPLARLAEDGELAVYKHRGFWKSMDTYRDFLELNQMWERRDRPWQVW